MTRRRVSDTSDRYRQRPALGLVEAAVQGVGPWIEGMERQGQDELAASSQLPVRGLVERVGQHDRGAAKPEEPALLSHWHDLGVRLAPEQGDDPLFVDVVLPEGWRVQRTDHSLWTSLIDADNRVWGSIFYKAAFYDRDAWIALVGPAEIEGWSLVRVPCRRRPLGERHPYDCECGGMGRVTRSSPGYGPFHQTGAAACAACVEAPRPCKVCGRGLIHLERPFETSPDHLAGRCDFCRRDGGGA